MSRKTEAVPVESYLRAASYREESSLAAIARKRKPEPEPRADAAVTAIPLRADRKKIEEALESGSCAEIADVLTRGRFVPSAVCDYRMMAETTQIPQNLQLALAKRFIELAENEESGRESKPNKTGIGILVATALGAFTGLGESEFVAGVISSAVAAVFYWRRIEKRIDTNKDLALEILASERLTCNDARDALRDYIIGNQDLVSRR